jgi:hypothetical protein
MQAAKTYLERKFEDFAASSADELIKHGLRALSASVPEGELTQENCTVAIVGKGLALTILEGDSLKPHIDALKVRSPAFAHAHPGAREGFSVPEGGCWSGSVQIGPFRVSVTVVVARGCSGATSGHFNCHPGWTCASFSIEALMTGAGHFPSFLGLTHALYGARSCRISL